MNTNAAAGHPVPRNPPFTFAGAPRLWMRGDRVATHLINAVNLLFPAGERFFVRSVHRYKARLTDPALLERVRGFERQEGHHARAHDDWASELERQGFRTRGFLRFYEAICYRVIEPLAPAMLSLSVTAAVEHFTAVLARDVLTLPLLDKAHSEVRKLLLWHAAEELEHKSVAFDVLLAVAPGYVLRALGMVLAATFLGAFWAIAAAMLLWQDRGIERMPAPPHALSSHTGRIGGVFVRGILEYLRPGFHPDQVDDRPLYEPMLSSLV